MVPRPILDLASGNPDARLLPPLSPALAAVDAGQARVNNVESVLPELRDIAVARFAVDGVPVHEVAVCNGALDAMERVLTARIRPGELVAVEDPGYPPVLYLTATLGLKTVAVPVDDEGLTPDGLDHALREGARAVIVTPRAQNPSGAFTSPARATALGLVLAAHPGTLLVEDDHAADIAGAALTTLAAPGQRHWAVIRSASKSLGADLRLAVMAADRETLTMVRGRQRRGPGWVSGLIQQIVAHQWSEPTALEALSLARRAYAERRSALIAALSAHGVEARGRTGLNVWVPTADEDLVAARLLDAGYLVAPGRKYRRQAPPGVRVTVSNITIAGAAQLADSIAAALEHRTDRLTAREENG